MSLLSKELLTIVLKLEYNFQMEPIKEWQQNIIEWYRTDVYMEQMYSMNIYELAHKCKEWARIKYNFYIMPTFQCQSDGHIDMIVTDNEDFINNRNERYSVSGDTELEAVFKACQWVLDNKDKR